MPLTGKKYFVLSNTRSSQKARSKSMETLRRWLVQCPKCSEVRIVVGARENDGYVCKDCGHSFVIKRLADNELQAI